jgi:hypothetical protein
LLHTAAANGTPRQRQPFLPSDASIVTSNDQLSSNSPRLLAKRIVQRRGAENRTQTCQHRVSCSTVDKMNLTGQRAAPHVTGTASQRPQDSRFPQLSMSEIDRVLGAPCALCLCSTLSDDRSTASHHAFGRLCLRRVRVSDGVCRFFSDVDEARASRFQVLPALESPIVSRSVL